MVKEVYSEVAMYKSICPHKDFNTKNICGYTNFHEYDCVFLHCANCGKLYYADKLYVNYKDD